MILPHVVGIDGTIEIFYRGTTWKTMVENERGRSLAKGPVLYLSALAFLLLVAPRLNAQDRRTSQIWIWSSAFAHCEDSSAIPPPSTRVTAACVCSPHGRRPRRLTHLRVKASVRGLNGKPP